MFERESDNAGKTQVTACRLCHSLRSAGSHRKLLTPVTWRVARRLNESFNSFMNAFTQAIWKIIEPLRIIKLESSFVKVRA